MARLQLFQYVVLKHSTDSETDSEVLIPSGEMLAKNDRIVANKLVRLLPETEVENLDNIEIIVRPF